MNSQIKAKCRNCNKLSPADQFKLHFEMRTMVCPTCFSGKTQKLEEQEQKKKEAPAKPAGWDSVDDYLEKSAHMKGQEIKGKFEKIPGTGQVRFTCGECKFGFKYDPFRKRPRNCPYCNEEIPRLKTFNLL